MRIPSTTTWLAFGLAASLVVPGARADEAADARMKALEERLLALEDKLEQSEATVEQQAALLHGSGAPDVAQGPSGLDKFLSSLEIGGHVTASYLYNFNSPDVASRGTVPQPLCQFNCNHNEFKLDAAKIELGKPASEPGTAGFQLDLLMGQNADILRALSPDTGGAGAFGADDFSLFLQQAYVSYNLRGTVLKAGNFETLLGWELIDSHKNSNISHGILFTWAIPLYHTGVLASGSFSERVSWNLGVTNGFNNTIEGNDNKGLLGLISFEQGGFFTSLSGFFGAEATEGTAGQPGSTDDLLILDLVASYQAADNVALWLNADWGEQEDATLGSDSDYWGVALGADVGLTDKLSFSVRGEYFEDEDNVRGTAGAGFDGADVELISLTGTLKYAVTPNLYVRGELRYDEADDDIPLQGGDIFPEGSVNFDDSELYGIVEIGYEFD